MTGEDATRGEHEAPARPRSLIQPPRAGDVLGRFVLEQPLGHGAMATVFRARDTTLNRQVALKVLNPAIASQESGAERFRREALAVAALRHPHIVEVYDFVPAAHGHSAYLVEELVEGETLQEVLEARGGKLIPEVGALLVADVADALGAAHVRGVVHRDVKPANIMLERRERGARLVLMDFGVAHVGDMSTMTATGAMVGSPAYMAPEQARGREVGPSVDIWALGVLLYQVCTGALPFAGRDPLVVITAICKGEYKRAAQIDARVSYDLDRIIGKCLKAAPAERFSTAEALALALRACAGRVGLADSSEVIRQVLTEPAALHDTLGPRLAEAAVANAKQLLRKRQLARALGELGRATAYVPKHTEALRLIDSLSTQRRWGRVLLGAAGVFLVTATATAFLRTVKTTKPTARLASSAAAPLTRPEKLTSPAPRPADDEPQPPPPGPEVPGAAHAPPNRAVPRPRVRPRPQTHEHAPAAPTAALPPLQAPPSPDPSPLTPTPLPSPARVRLFARFAFCFPSLDGDDVRKAPPRAYDAVAPGRHEVYCALTRSSPRLRVGELNVLPGARLDVNIIPDDQGRPVLSSATASR
ncbi:MAG: serine/threonine protein kinase [Myxococcales bacterium]|nr:serine/threonine protein kinase [Myxococcales bacterium]